MNYERNEYRNRVLGCFLGKNAGGTLGMRDEWHRRINHVTYYTHEITGEPLPNDDMDNSARLADRSGRKRNPYRRADSRRLLDVLCHAALGGIRQLQDQYAHGDPAALQRHPQQSLHRQLRRLYPFRNLGLPCSRMPGNRRFLCLPGCAGGSRRRGRALRRSLLRRDRKRRVCGA